MRVQWAATALVVAAAIVGGFLLSGNVGSALRDDDPESGPAAPREDETTQVSLGRLRLQPDPGWTQLDRAPAVPGFAIDRSLGFAPYPGLNTVFVATLQYAEDGTLLPAGLRGDAPRPSAGRLAGIPAWFYRGLSAGRWRLDAAVVPTSQGVVTVACAVPGNAGDLPVGCLNGVRGLAVADASTLPPSASAAFQIQLPAALIELDTARVDDRTAIRRAKTPGGQARAAARLRQAHLKAAARLERSATDAEGGPALISALRASADAYRALERAANRRDRRAWTRARATARRAESALARALADAREAGTDGAKRESG
ncbi:hypothetical protein DVA67_022450 [Solirubrobacter sp. CPCC 204708]|uniref:Uncharacterized protein n=1 Tax=Solirubrobacter deserti TaxID=2282478 RepID=A0ABT4RI24_9ACTN|nr:hypothetical protein [Solirubrobacter deserti]MBE2318754.1 hypothetical protein [Solirubrobacter deserti]MDA0138133.1 hypothetical protein [Solirubrobacter deserti]